MEYEKMMEATVYEQFLRVVRERPSNIALIYLGRKFYYNELKEIIETVASSLYRLGLNKGDKALLYLPNCPQWIIIWFALQRLGVIAVPISPIYTTVDLLYMVNDSESKAIFCLDTNFNYVAEILPEVKVSFVVVTNLADLLPMWKKFIGWAFDKIPSARYSKKENVISFNELLKTSSLELPSYQVEGGDFLEMLYTGGTTGLPKGIPYTHRLFLESLWDQRSMSASYIPRGSDRVLQGGPLFHILGQAVGLGALLSGDTLVLLPRVNLDALMYHIEREQILTLFGVPTLYRMILEHDRFRYYNLKSLKYCFCGGDVLPEDIAERWKKEVGVPIYQGYGTTETCGGISLTPMGEEAPPGSAGRILPRWRVKLVDPDTLEPVSSEGELLVSSEHMVKEYFKKPEETAKCFIELEGRRWYRTRDIVKIDEKGWLYYVERSVDVIKHKGYRVAASEVEKVLQEHPAVMAACVIGIPDERVGERIKAFVVLKEDVKGISAYELIKWCRERLASYKVPHYIEFRDMLPKSKVGKILRRELRIDEIIKLKK